MKKLLFLVVMCFLLAAPAAYSCGCEVPPPDCPQLQTPDSFGLFFASTDKDIADCGTFCSRPGLFEWDGESVVALDLNTGDGFCRKPSPDGCLKWLLCDCEAVDKIKVNGKYGFTLEILTRGAKFESVASIEPPTITLNEYADKNDLCSDSEAISKPLAYHFAEGGQTVIVTNSYRRIFDRDSLYISLCDLPRIIVDERIVPYGTPIIIRLGLYDGTLVCAPECSRMCECTQVVGIASCFDECCYSIGYMPQEEGWWSGIAITNLSTHDGSAIIVFGDTDNREVVNISIPAMGIKAFTPASLGADFGNCWVLIKTSFTSRVSAFTGTSNMGYNVPVYGCGACQ